MRSWCPHWRHHTAGIRREGAGGQHPLCNSATPQARQSSGLCLLLSPDIWGLVGATVAFAHSGGHNKYYGCSANNRHVLFPVLEAGIRDPGVGRTGPSEASPLSLWTVISCPCPRVAAPCVWVSVS